MKNINAKKFINLISIQYILIFILILSLICKKSQANDIIYLDCIQIQEYGGANLTKKISIEINFTTEWAKVIGTKETYFKIRPTEKSILFMGSKKGKSEYVTGYLNRFTGVLTFFWGNIAYRNSNENIYNLFNEYGIYKKNRKKPYGIFSVDKCKTKKRLF